MAGESLYDVEYSQGIAMPSDAMGEDDYTQDVFVQTRPEVFDFDHRDRGEPNQGDPFYQNYDMDEEIKYQEKSLQRYNQNPKNFDNQQNYLTNPLNMLNKKGSAFRVVESYLITGATPTKNKPYDKNKPVPLQGRAPTLAKLMHYTSSFSKKRTPKTSVSIVKSDENNLAWTYRVKGREKWSDPSGHLVHIKLEAEPGMKDFREMKVKVTCDCKFWKFWGPDFNSGNGGRGMDPYRLGPSKIDNGVSKAPNVRDPGRHNFICKHVAAVGKVFQKYAAKHNLDTYKQVDAIFNELEKQEKDDSSGKDIEGIKAIVDKMDNSDQRSLKPLIDKYDKEEDEPRKERMKKGILSQFEDSIETQDKNWLMKTVDFIKKFFRMSKGSSTKKASVARVLEMYIKEN